MKGHHYASLLYDIEGKRVIEVVEHRTLEAASTLLKSLPEQIRSDVRAVAVDMWDPFLYAIKEHLPSAKIVHDKYHIASYLTKAVDDVRRSEHKMLKNKGDNALKSTKYLWLRNPENWTEGEESTFKELQDRGFKVGRAWAIKETFHGLWEYTYRKSAKKFFDGSYWWATHSRLEPMIKVAKTLNRHLDNILTYLQHRITNATAEGFNSKVKAIKAASRGFRNFVNYRAAILFHCGRLDLYPH